MVNPENRLYAVIENNKVINVIIGLEEEIAMSHPDMYIEYTNGWDHNNNIDGGDFFPKPIIPEVTE